MTPESARPLRAFIATETGSAALLLAATLLALIWANSPASGAYEDLWGTLLTVGPGSAGVTEDLGHWVNDGLMVVFFYVVGLEIRRELAVGALREWRAAAIPAIAALAGMVVPALIYLAFNGGGDAARGWGVVMATDIAFVLGAVAVLGSRIPSGVRVFLLTLAIVDDIGAIAVIAAFYTDDLDTTALAAAVAIVAVIAVARRFGPAWRAPAYVVAGFALWYATLKSGVHPTIAGVVLGLLTAVHPERLRRADPAGAGEPPAGADSVAAAEPSANERFSAALHPWSSYVVIPIFALANAGVALGDGALERALSSPVTLGVVAGLLVGKALGITAATLGAVRLRVGPLPGGMEPRHVPGAATLAGIGFTVSLFVAELAFSDPALRDEAKVGVLAASVLAAVLGLAALATRRGPSTE